eukprot:TRINITY_DN23471_c0_g1_i1.p2 TRINITY_DN23471_c0_g1~~TRINITY_DN23471_c0_g1_i1.p2  ORF type:complete len:749 (+),score=139.12 TRINITY_DN23471_c0_g1_i1:80-2248(+)
MGRPALGAAPLLLSTLTLARAGPGSAPAGSAPTRPAAAHYHGAEESATEGLAVATVCNAGSGGMWMTGLQLSGMNGAYFTDHTKVIHGKETYWMLQGTWFLYNCGQEWYIASEKEYPITTSCWYYATFSAHPVEPGVVATQWDGTTDVPQPNVAARCFHHGLCSTERRSNGYPCMCDNHRNGGCASAQMCDPTGTPKCSHCPAVQVQGLDAAVLSMLQSRSLQTHYNSHNFAPTDGTYFRDDTKVLRGHPTFWQGGGGGHFFYMCIQRWHLLHINDDPDWRRLDTVSGPECHGRLVSAQYTNYSEAPLAVVSWERWLPVEQQWAWLASDNWYDIMTCPDAATPAPAAPTGYPVHPTASPTAEWVRYPYCVDLGGGCWRSMQVTEHLHYGNNERCNITVNGPHRIEMFRFDTETYHDTLTVDGVDFSGIWYVPWNPDNLPYVVVRSYLFWQTDRSITAKGWHFCLHPTGPGTPTGHPTLFPTGYPSRYPTDWPTRYPSRSPFPPTGYPTHWEPGTPSQHPTGFPSRFPTIYPTWQPTGWPSYIAGTPSAQPTGYPTRYVVGTPSAQPTGFPSGFPSGWPAPPTGYPSHWEPGTPSQHPTGYPSGFPTGWPVYVPGTPSAQPTGFPTRWVPGTPSGQPTGWPTGYPSRAPTGFPSRYAAGTPSAAPSGFPSDFPSGWPTKLRTSYPSGAPTGFPSRRPTGFPTFRTVHPVRSPTVSPSSGWLTE